MYTMRVDAPRRLLLIDCEGRLATEEALRAVSQAFTLAEASDLRAVLCDLNGVRRGPGGLLVVAAALASRFNDTMRFALTGNDVQLAVARRFVRFSGVREGLRTFVTRAEAESWLEAELGSPKRRFSSTELRHAKDLAAARTTAPRVEPAAEPEPAGRQRQRTPAA